VIIKPMGNADQKSDGSRAKDVQRAHAEQAFDRAAKLIAKNKRQLDKARQLLEQLRANRPSRPRVLKD
jgi:hypothetical protein